MNNLRDAGRYLEELFGMQFQRSSCQHHLCKTALALGFPFLESQLPVALRHLRSAISADRDSLFLWWNFASWSCARINLYHLMFNTIQFNAKKSTTLHSLLISGFSCTIRSSPKKALPFFEAALKNHPTDPVAALSLASCLLNLAQAGDAGDEEMRKGFGLIFELASSAPCWTMFNVGRAYHHVGMLAEAALFYKECIATCTEEDSISRDAAFNLHLIFKASGNKEAALQVLKDHMSF